MVHGRRHRKSGQHKTDEKRQPPQYRQGGGHQKVIGVVLGHAHEFRQGGRDQKAEGQPVHDKSHPAVQKLSGKTVRALSVHHLGQRRTGRVANIFLNISCRRQSVHVDGVQPPGELVHYLRIGHAVHIHNGAAGERFAADHRVLQLQRGGADPPAHKGGVYTESLHKGIFGALHGLFQRGFRDAAGVARAHLEGHGNARPVENDGAPAVGHVVSRICGGGSHFWRVGVHAAPQYCFGALFGGLRSAQPGFLRQRAQNIFRHVAAGHDAVQPHCRHRHSGEPRVKRALLQIAAVGKDIFQVFCRQRDVLIGRCKWVRSRLLRRRPGFQIIQNRHIGIMSGVGPQYLGVKK